MAQQVSTNTFGVAKWIVSADATQGTHTTIASALTSASSGDTVYVRDGSYTENLTLKAGVNIAALTGSQNNSNVKITGKLTATFTGSVSISNIDLVTNSDFCITSTGSNAAMLNLYGCYINASNNTAINCANANASINLNQCSGNVGTTGIGLFSFSAGTHTWMGCLFGNTGASTTASTVSAGSFICYSSSFGSPLTTSSTGIITFTHVSVDCSAVNTTSLTHGGSASNCYYCLFSSGTASAVSISATLVLAGSCVIASNNTNAVTGAGTLSYTPLVFNGSSSTVNTTTQTPLNSGPKMYASGGISFDSGTNTLANYAEGSFTPTMVGGSTAGSTTYTTQVGFYRRIGNLVTIQFTVIGTAATGTGNVTFGGFPFTIKNQANGAPTGSLLASNGAAFVFPTGTTMLTLLGLINTTTAIIWASGSAVAGSQQQMANATFNFQATMSYEI